MTFCYFSSHSQMEHYFFSYLLTCEVYLIKVLEIMAQMRQYIIFLSLKPIKVSSDFISNYLKKKSCMGHHNSEISKTKTKTMISSLWTQTQGCQGCQGCQNNQKDQGINNFIDFLQLFKL